MQFLTTAPALSQSLPCLSLASGSRRGCQADGARLLEPDGDRWSDLMEPTGSDGMNLLEQGVDPAGNLLGQGGA